MSGCAEFGGEHCRQCMLRSLGELDHVAGHCHEWGHRCSTVSYSGPDNLNTYENISYVEGCEHYPKSSEFSNITYCESRCDGRGRLELQNLNVEARSAIDGLYFPKSKRIWENHKLEGHSNGEDNGKDNSAVCTK